MNDVWIRTNRVVLRRPDAADAADVLAILSDPAVVEHNPSDLVTSADEAAGGILQWTRQRLSGEVVLARIRPDHRASRRVALRCGLERDPAFDDWGLDGLDWAYTSRRELSMRTHVPEPGDDEA